MIDRTTKVRWAQFVVAMLPVMVVWALANPMFASPDETAHMVRAQGFSNLDFAAPFETDGIPIESVECFRFQSEVTADCQDLTWGADGTELDVPTENYPPLFHAAAAIPATVTSGLAGAYVMRLWLAVLCVGLLAWAGVLLARLSLGAWPVAGLLLAVTPMAVFTSATVNPTGLAVAFTAVFVAGMLAWCSEHVGRTGGAVAAVTVGAVGLATTRRDGVFWLAIVALVLVPLLPLRRPARWRPRTGRGVAVGLAAVCLTVVAVVAWAAPTAMRFYRNWRGGQGSAWGAARDVQVYLRHVVGMFGWIDSPVNEETFLLAVAVLGGVIVVALASGSRRLVTSTALGLGALLAAPIAFGAFRFPYLQGRYLLPVFVALMLVAAVAHASGELPRPIARRFMALVLVVWVGVHFLAFVQNLRRYAVGRTGTWEFLWDAEWHPPMMSNDAAVVLFAGALAVAVVVLTRLLLELERDRVQVRPTEPGEADPGPAVDVAVPSPAGRGRE